MKTLYFLSVTAFLCTSLVHPSVVSAENAFVNGMSWESTVYGTQSPVIDEHVQTVVIDGETEAFGTSCLQMWEITDNDDTTKSPAAIVYSEGDKIYFQTDPTAGKWELLYDFGLTEGDKCTVCVPGNWGESSEGRNAYLKCTAVYDSDEYPGLQIMEMEEFADETFSTSIGGGKWIKGISSERGVLDNSFGMDGIGSSLTKVARNGDVIWKLNTASITNTAEAAVAISVNGNTMTLSGIVPGSPAVITGTDGVTVARIIAASESVSVVIPSSGIYLVTVNGKIYKAVVR